MNVLGVGFRWVENTAIELLGQMEIKFSFLEPVTSTTNGMDRIGHLRWMRAIVVRPLNATLILEAKSSQIVIVIT